MISVCCQMSSVAYSDEAATIFLKKECLQLEIDAKDQTRMRSDFANLPSVVISGVS
jgi:tRNA threonylcarbamoyladenosine modification (KEOPS) complex  Pcc1 subunit